MCSFKVELVHAEMVKHVNQMESSSIPVFDYLSLCYYIASAICYAETYIISRTVMLATVDSSISR